MSQIFKENFVLISNIKQEVSHFFENRFGETVMCRAKLEGGRFNQISESENNGLIAWFVESKVKEAVWEYGENKSPGLDGYNFHFIKAFWSLLKNDVMKFIGDFHTNEVFPKGANSSFISLIPKVHDPQGLEQYRPISLIGCMYNIVAKVLSKRLKKVLGLVIYERKYAFLKRNNFFRVC